MKAIRIIGEQSLDFNGRSELLTILDNITKRIISGHYDFFFPLPAYRLFSYRIKIFTVRTARIKIPNRLLHKNH